MIAQVLVEDLRGLGALLFHQVPLVGGDNHAAARVFRGAGDRAILIGGSHGRVDHQHDDVGAFNGALGQHDAERFNLARLRDLARLANTGGVDNAELAAVPHQHRVDRVARGARHLGHDHPLLTKQAVDQRRLAGIGTTDNRNRGLALDVVGDLGLVRAGLDVQRIDSARLHLRQDLDHDFQQVAHRLSMLGADFDDGLEAHAIELKRAVLAATIIHFIDGQDHGHAGVANRRRNLLVAGDESLAAIDHENNEFGGCERALAAFDHQLVQRILAGAKQAAGVGQVKPRIAPGHFVRDDVTGRSSDGGHD